MLSEVGDAHELRFLHDGGAFTSGDLVRLTEQDTSKRDAPPTGRPRPIGRFGTGFLTTHLLARVAEVEGIVSDPGEEPKRFELPLDRSGDTEEALREGVEATFEKLSALDDQPPLDEDDLSANGFTTCFAYQLDDSGLAVAHAGLDDLYAFLPFTLALSGRIRRVEVERQHVVHEQTRSTQGEKIESSEVRQDRVTYSVGRRKALADGIEQVTIQKNGADARTLIVASGEDASVVLPASVGSGEVTLRGLGENTPRLFCDFPLVGAEAFPFPAVVNGPRFHPTEPRNGVLLTDKDHYKPNENKEVFAEALELFEGLVAHATASEWRNLYHLADLGSVPDRMDWVSKDWFDGKVKRPLRDQLLKASLVETADGQRAPMETESEDRAFFPYASSREAREQLWSFAHPLMARRLPRKEHVHEWHRCLWKKPLRLDLDQLLKRVSAHETVSSLAEALDATEADAVGWLDDLVCFLSENDWEKYLNPYKGSRWRRKSDGSHSLGKKTRRVPVLPDQRGTFRPKDDLFLDDEIDEGLKDITAALGEDYRAKLLDPRVYLDLPGKTKTDQDLAHDIADRARPLLAETPRSEETKHIFRTLLRWFDEHPQEAESLFSDLYENQHRLRTDEEMREDRRKAEAYEKQQDQLEEAGFSSTAELLEAYRKQQSLQEATDAPETGTNGHDREKLIAILLEHSIRTSEELAALREANPNLFEHFPEPAIEKLRLWLDMIARVKRRVRDHLQRQPAYDCTGWQEHARYPTVIGGVEKHGRAVYLVLRPADGDKVIFYEAMELDLLDQSDTELWVEGGARGPEQLTVGKVLRSLGAKPKTGLRLDPST